MSEWSETTPGLPALPLNFVSRARLTSRLSDALTLPLAVVSAPSGYGKTVLLLEWIRSRQNRSEQSRQTGPAFVWTPLHESLDEPRRFWSHTIAAFKSLAPPAEQALLSSPDSLQASSIDSRLAAVTRIVTAQTHPIVLVLDDYHLVGTPALHAGLSSFIDHLPPQLHILIASQTDPPLPLGRWRARGQLLELGAHDLRFTHDEATAFLDEHLKRLHAPPLRPEEVAALEAHTQGWIAGLKLAALSWRGRRDARTLVNALGGRPVHLADDLGDEILRRQPPGLKRFLLQTSILDRLCAPLCDAVTESDDGQKMLERLEQADLFTARLDPHGHWYQSHRLFADFLRNRLFHAWPEQLPALHRRASQWYARHQLPDEAIRHALAANDRDRAARLIGEAGPRLLERGEPGILLGWLAALPEGILRQSASLCLLHARALLLCGHAPAAQRRLADAETAPDCRPGQQAEIAALRAGQSLSGT